MNYVKGTAYSKKRKGCFKETIKFGEGNIKIWACFSANGVGALEIIDGNLNAEYYHNILLRNFKNFAEKKEI